MIKESESSKLGDVLSPEFDQVRGGPRSRWSEDIYIYIEGIRGSAFYTKLGLIARVSVTY